LYKPLTEFWLKPFYQLLIIRRLKPTAMKYNKLFFSSLPSALADGGYIKEVRALAKNIARRLMFQT